MCLCNYKGFLLIMAGPGCSESSEILENIDYGHILSSSPPIVEGILKNLNAKDLCNCAQVCTLWKSMADLEKNRRKDIAWFCRVALIEDYSAPSHVRHHPSTTLCESLALELCWDLNKIRIRPAFCIAFASSLFIQQFPHIFHQISHPEAKKCKMEGRITKRKFLKDVMTGVFGSNLPRSCLIDFMVTPGVIGCCANKNPVEVEDGPAISGVLFPNFPDVKIIQVPLDGKQPTDISKIVPEDTKIQCVLVFLTREMSSAHNKLMQSVLLRESSQVAIGGLAIERSATAQIGSILVFCGTGMEAGSIVISQGSSTDGTLETLKGFRDAGLVKPDRKCVAFMFTCVAKGYSLYKAHNVESNLFKKLYPNVPLIGATGNGEIGIPYLSHLPTKHRVLEIGMLKKCITKFIRSYTTVFVMLSFKTS